MSVDAILQLLLGGSGALVLALGIIYSLLYTRKIEPGYVCEALREQVVKLEKENVQLHAERLQGSIQNARMEEQIRSLTAAGGQLTEELRRLREKLGND